MHTLLNTANVWYFLRRDLVYNNARALVVKPGAIKVIREITVWQLASASSYSTPPIFNENLANAQNVQ